MKIPLMLGVDPAWMLHGRYSKSFRQCQVQRLSWKTQWRDCPSSSRSWSCPSPKGLREAVSFSGTGEWERDGWRLGFAPRTGWIGVKWIKSGNSVSHQFPSCCRWHVTPFLKLCLSHKSQAHWSKPFPRSWNKIWDICRREYSGK